AVGALALTIAAGCYLTLPHWSLRAELVPHIQAYLLGTCWSLPAFALTVACRNAFEAIPSLIHFKPNFFHKMHRVG
ncbi:hypothetical protein, partial [Moorena sp. SIO2C4]|uniref:hypothetical protein n=1 Tax=Moorena sp. SIO2C4 TaxID=2607824 RepID=UPI00257EB6A2